MKTWMRKIAVAFIAFITLGLYVPSFDVEAHLDKEEGTFQTPDLSEKHELETEEVYAEQLMNKAKQQTSKKFGQKIERQVEGEFEKIILPKLETTLQTIFTKAGKDMLPFYEITENPSRGYGERIFNVYNVQSEEIVAKFHVRRDYKPGEGYWFNFHYHLKEDQFETHYDLGNIYWDKNMPPKWMAH